MVTLSDWLATTITRCNSYHSDTIRRGTFQDEPVYIQHDGNPVTVTLFLFVTIWDNLECIRMPRALKACIITTTSDELLISR